MTDPGPPRPDTPQGGSLRRRANRTAAAALVMALVALALSALPTLLDLGPAAPAEDSAEAARRFLPHPMLMLEAHPVRTVGRLFGLLAASVGVWAWTMRARPRVAGTAIVCGLAAVFFEYFLFGLAIAVVVGAIVFVILIFAG